MQRAPSHRKRANTPRATTPPTSTKRGGGQLRIIGGSWRGRKLPVADLPGLRPTSDRIRETVFNWLNPYLPGAQILDCFSGSGALALEALSRGAKSATMLEKATPAVNTLKSNLATLKADNAEVVATDSLLWLKKPSPRAFDVVFLDPPFRMNMLEQTCALLASNGYLHPDSLIYIETERELSPAPVPSGWQPLKSKTGGQVSFSLWVQQSEDQSERGQNRTEPNN